MALLKTNTGIGTTNPTSALHVIGDVLVTGVVTATTFSGNINAGVGTITTLNSTNATITNINSSGITTVGIVTANQLFVSGVSTFVGVVTNRSTIFGTQLSVSGVSTFHDNVRLGDNDILSLGESDDLQLVHDGSNSFIKDTGTGSLILNTNKLEVKNAANNETGLVFNQDGAVELFFDNSKRLETTGIGISLSEVSNGTATITGPSTIIIDPAAIGDDTGIVRVKGDLYVDGTQFIVNSSTIELADLRVGIATTVGTNLLLDGGGIGIGSTSILKTFTYNFNSDALKSSEHLDLAFGKTYKINGTEVLSATQLTVPNIFATGITTIGIASLSQLLVTGISTFTGLVDANGGATIDNVQIGISGDNEIDTSTGDLILDSAAGTVNVTDQLVVTGISTFNSDVDIDQSLNVDNNLTVTGVSTFVGIVTNQSTIFGKQLSVSGISTFTGLVDANGGAEIDNIRIGIAGDNEIDTSTGNLTIDSAGGTVTIDDQLTVTGSATFNVDVDIDRDLNVDRNVTVTGLSTFTGLLDANGGATIDNIRIGIANDNTIDTITGGLTLDSNSGTVTVDDNLAISGSNTLSFNSSSLNISHSGGNANIFNGLGDLILGADGNGSIRLERVGVATLARFTHNGSAELYYAGSKKLETIGSGVTITGTTFTNQLNVSGISTLAANGGITTTGGDLFVGGDLYVADDLVFDEATVRNINVTGIGTIATVNGNVLNYAVGNIVTGVVTTISGTNLNYTGVGTIVTFNSTTGTITNLSGTNATYNTGSFTNANVVTGIVTELSGTNATYNTGSFTNANVVTGVITTISGTNLNYTGVGTISTLDVTNANLTNINSTGITTLGIVTANQIFVSGVTTSAGGFVGNLTGIAASATQLVTPRTFEITGDIVASPISFDGTGNVSLAATIQPNSVGLGTDTFGDYVQSISGTANQITVTNGSGEGSTPVISIPTNPVLPGNVTIANDLQVNNNLNVTGNITIGGTSAYIIADDFRVKDADIVLGFTTNTFGQDVSNDDTANHGGVAVASTVGTPLVELFIAGIETNPATYKKIMWFKAGAFAGLGTDAWLMNYAVGIGSTQFPTGTRLAAGSVQFTERDLAVVRDINASGILTASTGNLSTLNATTGNIVTGVITSLSGTNATYTTGSFTNANVVTGVITSLSGTNATYTTGSFETANIVTGIVTSISGTNLNYTGVGTVATLNSTTGTITNLSGTNATYNTGSFTTGNIVTGVVTTLSGTDATYTNGNFTTLNATTGNIVTGLVTTISGSNLTYTTGNLSTANIVTGVVTTISGTNLNYTGVGTVATLDSTTGTITNLSGTNATYNTGSFTNANVVTGLITSLSGTNATYTTGSFTNGNILTGVVTTLSGTNATYNTGSFTNANVVTGVVTSISGTNLNYTGVGTITTLNSTNATLTNINSTGITTLSIVNASQINASGIITATQFSTGATGSAINITSSSITGPSSITIDPAGVGDDTGAVRIKGDLYVDGTQFIVNSSIVELADLRVGIATTVGTNLLLDGGGIGIGSANILKTFTYNTSSDSLKSSENLDIASGKTYKINGTDVLSSTTLGSGVVNSSLTSVGTLVGLQVSGIATFQSNVNLGDNDILGIGDGSDLQLYHNGSNSFIDDTGTGSLFIRGSSGVEIQSISGESYAKFNENGSVELYFDNSKKFETIGSGVTITGTTFTNQLNVSGASTLAANGGITTTGGDLFVGGDLYIADDLVFDEATVRNINVTGLSTLGIASASTLFVAGVSTITGVRFLPTGIVTSANPGITTVVYYGDGSNLIGVNAFNVISQDLTASPVYPTFASNVGVTSIGISSTQIAYVPSTNRFGIGTTDPKYTLEIVGNTRVSGLTSVTNLEIYGTVGAGNTIGSDGQYLRSTGVGVTWASFPTLRTTGITTATQGQTSFSFPYNVGFLDVYVNGVKLIDTEFTAVNGANVTLGSPAFADDIVEFVSYNTVSNGGSGGGPVSLDSLTDVIITSAAPGETLGYNGTYWVNDYTFTSTTSSTSQVGIHSLSTSTYRSVEYFIQATEGTNFHATKIIALHDGTTAYHTEYGSVFNNVGVSTYDVDISGGNMRLLVTPTSASSTTFKIKFTAVKS